MMNSKLKKSGIDCSCGAIHEPTCVNAETAMNEAVENAVIQAVFPDLLQRRQVLKAVGAATLMAALGDLLPLSTLKAIAQEKPKLEKININVGFLGITCATPLIMGVERGIFAKNGLKVSLQKIPGIGLIRDKMLNGELDVSQQVMPVALATTAGLGGNVVPTKVLTILNQHGNSLVLAMKHKNNRDPKNWKGFVFAVPFEQSHQTLQLRYYVAEAGLDPDKDIQYRVVPPSEYVSNLRVGNIDGFFGGEPGGQRAVFEGAGFIHLLSKEIWEGHPCCSVTATDAWIKQNPNTFLAVFRSVVEAGLWSSKIENRDGLAKILSAPNYLNAPEGVIEQVIKGRYADGLGNIKDVPDRVKFDPFPHYSMAVWLSTQMQRWNMLPAGIDHKQLAQRVMLATDAQKIMAEQGVNVPEPGFRKERILGKDFDSNEPEKYLNSLPRRG
ncbi:MAG TPA: CmpA/NrtA family ABC transporter substrate-binding protein [Xanthobacteraceae bacterium]|nr:CmpA/NrtA family ABC transporter substrate-binding protein [Xanthobacteraceae bacterium]